MAGVDRALVRGGRMGRALTAFLAALVLAIGLVFAAPVAYADGTGLGGAQDEFEAASNTEDEPSPSPPSFGAGAQIELLNRVPFDPDTEPARAHESVGQSEPVCADAIRYVFSFIFGLGGSFPEVWCSPIACAGERVDELVPAAGDPSVWAEYIYNGNSGLAGQVVATANAVGASFVQLATHLANGERPDPEAIRVFNYCRHIDSGLFEEVDTCLLYTSPSPRDATLSRMPSSA